MDCLSVSNQICCCSKGLAYSLNSFYNISSPFELFPPMLWGGAGIGFTRASIEKLVMFDSKPHYNTDHTVSKWALDAGVRFRQISWSNKHNEWCRDTKSSLLHIHKVSFDTWKCYRSSQTHIYKPTEKFCVD